MKFLTRYSWLAILLIVAGCTVTTAKVGVISGTVTDVEGNPVADAEVFTQDKSFSSTRTLSNGTFYLTNVASGFTRIQVQTNINGRRYVGQQIAQIFESDQSKNINIMIAPENEQGIVEGYVSDFARRPVESARVFAGGALSSAIAITDRTGYYRIQGLPGGFEYPVVASRPGYENSRQNVQVLSGRTTVSSFTLNLSSNRPVNPPSGLTAIAWTLPARLIATRDSRTAQAYEAIKRWLDPQRPQKQTTRQLGNSVIEIDLSWDFESQTSLLGYGIYRGRTEQEIQTNAIAFLRDPLTDFFADLDTTLQPNVTYFYEMVSLNTDYLDDLPGSQSGRSERVSAQPLIEMSVTAPFPNQIMSSPPVFQWRAVSRADFYQVIIYDRFPDYLVDPYYPADPDNPGASRVHAPSTSLVYTGPTLFRGRTYYFVIVAYDAGRNSRSISQIVPFEVQ
jgi:hypothetical protein